MPRVLAFGTFDSLHEGHKSFFRQAKARGDFLLVVVAQDSVVASQKGRLPQERQGVRLGKVQRIPEVDEAILGDADASRYDLLERLEFDVLVLGYDQEPSRKEVRRLLDAHGKQHVRVVRLKPYKPKMYKSSYMRNDPASKSKKKK